LGHAHDEFSARGDEAQGRHIDRVGVGDDVSVLRHVQFSAPRQTYWHIFQRLQIDHYKLPRNAGQLNAYAQRPVPCFVKSNNVDACAGSKCAFAFFNGSAIVYNSTLSRLQQNVNAPAGRRAIRIAYLYIDLTGGIDALSEGRRSSEEDGHRC